MRDGDKEGGREGETAECRFRKIDRHIRVMLKHNKHLPTVRVCVTHSLGLCASELASRQCRPSYRAWKMNSLSILQLITVSWW